MITIYVVDDSDINLLIAKQALDSNYRVLTMQSAFKMFELLEKVRPDLILLDIEMPGMDGFEALLYMKSSPLYKDIPIIFFTGHTDTSIESRGFELGVLDFITKPFSPHVLINRVRAYMGIDTLIREKTEQLRRLQSSMVNVLADMVEERNKETTGHNDRMTAYANVLITGMRDRNVYADKMFGWDFDTVVASIMLHDMGMIRVPDSILNKPGKLDSEEFEIMKSHVSEGIAIIDRMIRQAGEGDFLRNAKLFTQCHHERWDGSGYPSGLAGTSIPLQGRIIALVDVYDALLSPRPYREALAEDDALQIIAENAGKHFDPEITKVFLEEKDQLKKARDALG